MNGETRAEMVTIEKGETRLDRDSSKVQNIQGSLNSLDAWLEEHD